ncbi:hypothetical protein JOD43_002543 [Pullulanibacillus pueri]|uniref:Uncharacterized protein n=1 Tax=Pullulanibacillus pueri TaxID=1437324 RepID=A0A8J3EMH3_9BACL|nr:hypothetical protein [Pullulanibacillus pueri]MBM7682368.1 hypothetical protein [Pullulanibacillus pueri]GGH80622.1 hypothetical protein GCM10007096_17300 [Pullulanibacillus pueri]
MNDLETRLRLALEKCEQLKKENAMLRKQLYINNNIPFNGQPSYDSKIITKQSSIKEKVGLFRSLFKGRTDGDIF